VLWLLCAVQLPRHSARVQLEAQRLQSRLEQLQAGWQQLAHTADDVAADPDGRISALMLTWQQQRLSALEAEVQRLMAVLFDAGLLQASTATSSSGSC
jgi:uncharacterized protein (DUF3084 family)